MNESDAVSALGALAQETRLRVFRMLIAASPGGLTPTELSESVGCAPTALSFHLKELSHAGLIASERDGRRLIYRACIPKMNGLLGFLTAHCCQGAVCLEATELSCHAS